MSAPEPEPGEPNQSGRSSGHDEGPAEDDDAGRSAKAAAILGAGLALAALGLYGTRAACSVLVGATIAVANLLTMRAIVRALIQPPDEPEDAEGEAPAEEEGEARRRRRDGKGRASEVGSPCRRLGIFAAFKILILFGGLWLLLSRDLVDPMPLVVGYGVLPLGIAASAVWSSLRSSR